MTLVKFEMAELARQIRPGLPVIFSAGYALEALIEQSRVPAQSIVLTKPYRKAEPAHRLREALTGTPAVVVSTPSNTDFRGSSVGEN